MAFLDFTQPLPGPAGQMSARDLAPTDHTTSDHATFEVVEWQVIGLARKDGTATLTEPGRLGRILGLVFGARPNPRLADARLEALRRLAVEAWHRGYAVSLSALAAFKAAGFTTAQLELLLATISAGRNARGRRSPA